MAIPVGSAAPEFTLTGTDGGQIRFARGANEHTFLVFWKSSCPYCQEYVPQLGAVFQRHSEAPVRVLGVAVGADTAESAARFQQSANFPFPTGVDEQREVRQAYQLFRVPTIVLVDPTGEVLRTYIGGRGEMVTAIDDALTSIEKGIAVAGYDLEGSG
ncbi:MAG: TlpA family protein disulfide reductase [Armatimonadetes bacterium]|jgi:peroxiredoxin|nr:TlpA family protein disulfide reductase [Armatimonadota bacterium]